MNLIPAFLVEAIILLSGAAAFISSLIGAYISKRSIRTLHRNVRKNIQLQETLLQSFEDHIFTEQERYSVMQKYLDVVDLQTSNIFIKKVNENSVRILKRATNKKNDQIFKELALEALSAQDQDKTNLQKPY